MDRSLSAFGKQSCIDEVHEGNASGSQFETAGRGDNKNPESLLLAQSLNRSPGDLTLQAQ